MGWSTELFCRVTFNRKTYNAKAEVEEDLARVQTAIADYKAILRDLALMTQPEKLLSLEEELSPYETVKAMFDETMECLEEDISQRDSLQLLLDNWEECHDADGLAINPPETITYDTAYLWGDYVEAAESDNELKE